MEPPVIPGCSRNYIIAAAVTQEVALPRLTKTGQDLSPAKRISVPAGALKTNKARNLQAISCGYRALSDS